MAAIVLIGSSAFGLKLGLPTFIAALAAVLFTTSARSNAIAEVVGAVYWSVLPLVAGLFLLVAALDSAAPSNGCRSLRIPSDADQRSELMAITIPNSSRSPFQSDGDHRSKLMPITRPLG